ncbi:hypothetical protein JCM10207_000592 [Rhodosporidiobolus poonsookiae]
MSASSSFHFSDAAPSSGVDSSSHSSTTTSPSLPPPISSTTGASSASGASSSPPSGELNRLSPPLEGRSPSTASTTPYSEAPTPLFDRPPSTTSSTRPQPARSISYKADDIWGTSPTDTSRLGGGESAFQRTARAASDGLILSAGTGFGGFSSSSTTGEGRAAGGVASRLSSLGSDESSDEQAFFREHQRRSLEHTASQRLTSSKGFLASPPLATAAPLSANSRAGPTSPFFQPPSFLSTAAAATSPASSTLPPLLSPTATSPPQSAAFPPPASANSQQQQADPAGPPGSKGATLHLGDLDVWMDEAYVRECCQLMGWDNVVNIKMSRGASPSSGYCFLTFPNATDASRALARFNAAPPMLMPRSGRTFKLNWGTGLPGLQPRWDGEYSVFVGDLAREVGESELMTLFTPLFPSTKSAKVMCDPSTGLSRGYGFVRFGEESDMQRALVLGANPNTGLLLHGRTIRISEASGPGMNGANGPSAVDGLPHLRERTRTRSGEGMQPPHGTPPHLQQQQPPQQQQQGYFPPYPPHPPPHLADGPYGDHANPYASPLATPGAGYASPLSPPPGSIYGPPPPLPGNGMLSPPLPGALGARGGPLSPGLAGPNGLGEQQRAPIRQPIPAGSVPPGGDPNNTTVFVGGLPACISEETLKSFFHHFGEITYCKIPAGKGCGFVQFVRRQDAELAIAKMNDFPIHGKSRIRLSWGRSQGDKQVEHVRKLASALGVPFDAVWRMVQGQDNSTIKQIASAVGTNGSTGAQAAVQGAAGTGSPPSQQQTPSASPPMSHALNPNRMDLRAVANAAGLTESEVRDLVKSGANGLTMPASGSNTGANSSHSNSTAGSDFFARSAALTNSATSLESAASPASPPSGGEPRSGPYSRVSPSSFSSAFGPPGATGLQLPLSPPPTAGPTGNSFAAHQAQYPPGSFPAHSHSPSPYTAIRPESYQLQHPAASPYERVDFADGGRPPNGFQPDRYQPQAFGVGVGGMSTGKWHEQPHAGPGGDSHSHYTTSPPPPVPNGIEDGFAGLSLHQQHQSQPLPRTLPPPLARHTFTATAPDFFPGALASPTGQHQQLVGGEPNWSWGAAGAA